MFILLSNDAYPHFKLLPIIYPCYVTILYTLSSVRLREQYDLLQVYNMTGG